MVQKPKIKSMLIPENKRNRPGHKLDPEYITIHDTGNQSNGADAEMHGRYLIDHDVITSWHFTVDDKEIVQHLPLDENGWHAGDGGQGTGNRKSIGIEICEDGSTDRLKAEKLAIKLTRWLMDKFNITSDKVKQHNDWSGKDCPAVLRGNRRPASGETMGWDNFIKELDSMAEIEREVQGTIDGKRVEKTGYIIDGRTYVPLRFLAEKMGARVDWDSEKGEYIIET